MRTARFPAQRSLDDFDFGESPADKNALLRLPDGHYLSAAHSRSDPVQISALTPVQICTLIDSPHCAFHQCRLSSRAETHKYTENTMTTTTKAAFVADLAKTHNINPQNAQEAVNAGMATLTHALIDGHGIKLPGLRTFSLKERQVVPDTIRLLGKIWGSCRNAPPGLKRLVISKSRSGNWNGLARQNETLIPK